MHKEDNMLTLNDYRVCSKLESEQFVMRQKITPGDDAQLLVVDYKYSVP